MDIRKEKGQNPRPGLTLDDDHWICTIRRRTEEMRQSTAKTVSLDEAVEEAKGRISKRR